MSFIEGAAGIAAATAEPFAIVGRPERQSEVFSGFDGRGEAGFGQAGDGKARALMALRERIARIEGTQLNRLDDAPLAPCGVPGTSMGNRAGVGDKGACPSGQGRRDLVSLGFDAADAALSGGFPGKGLTEIHVDETRQAGTGAGFALSLAVLFSAAALRPALWIGDGLVFSEAGLPYLPGLVSHGLDPGALLLVKARRLEQALWAAEEAARSPALSLVILEVRGNPAKLSLEGTRRLHFRAREAGLSLLLLRQGGRAEATAAPYRLRVAPGPAAGVPDIADERLIGPPVLHIRVEKSPSGRPTSFLLEWNSHERRFQDPRAADGRISATGPDHGRQPAAAVDRPYPAREARPLLAFKRAS